MKWQFVIIAQIALAGPVAAEPKEFAYAFYEFVSDHPNCNGLGHLAYRATFDVALDEANNLHNGADGICEMRVRRGGQTVTTPIPCGDDEGRTVDAEAFVLSDAFCAMTAELRPSETRLRGELIGCISMAGHQFVGGTWEATTIRPDQTNVINGAFDDDRLDLHYNALKDLSAARAAPSISIWLRMEDATLNDGKQTVVRSYGQEQFIWLIDPLQPGCETDPKRCWAESVSWDLIPEPETIKETSRYCTIEENGEFSRTYTIRDVPKPEGE
jgi:hypothetical protein